MKTFDLERVVTPPAPVPKLCVACKGFRAECVVPVGKASAAMCWLCAHHVVDHGCEPYRAMTAECECLPHQVYPGREPPTVDELIAERLRLLPDEMRSLTPEELGQREHGYKTSPSDETIEKARQLLMLMTRAQRRAFLNGGKPASRARQHVWSDVTGAKTTYVSKKR